LTLAMRVPSSGTLTDLVAPGDTCSRG
jgi:hypothetical protein